MLQTLLENYQPFDEHETAMTERLRVFLAEAAHADAFGRELAGSEPRWGHVTGSAWVVDETLSRTVLVHHAKLGKWVQPGGHCESETDVLAVAQREAEEETSLDVEPITTEIFDIDVHEIPEYWRTPAHNHYDVRFLLRANSSHLPQTSDESHAVRWFSLDEALEISGEESVARMVEKTRRLAQRRANP
ncbi:MAG TPA: NUDIX hydrolase [Abditibacteriaceae bacterium]|jgi:8-oxo-dGTP pyrophosphatase MutT (NUDIX family)